jgi:hypothetical protein
MRVLYADRERKRYSMYMRVAAINSGSEQERAARDESEHNAGRKRAAEDKKRGESEHKRVEIISYISSATLPLCEIDDGGHLGA